MNDLMTQSFLSYVELKKQAMRDMESEPDLEMGELDPADEKNLTKFFEEVNGIKTEMEEITNLLLDLQDLNEDSKSTHSTKVLKGIRDRINSDMVTILRKAKIIKSRLESLDKSNVANRSLSMAYKEGSPIDRTRVSVTDGLRVKLREMMHHFQALREQILKDHREGLKRRYYNVTGEHPSEEVLEKMVLGGGKEKVFEGKVDLVLENKERHEALKDIQRSLTELHQLFLDMAVLIETQGDEIDNIEENVARGRTYISGGTNGLYYAKQMKKNRNWGCWIGIVLLVLMVILVSILAS
ncbi:syntaxin-112 [Ricinus communis]|uniref:Syntaxin, putative n=1 Tax=Ricinus communis TaxID=3988 RepID=B9RH57_RICCO|nr:syntaxin-112 [Ricinus communis]XP_048233574.1 syntaxin-112 [Ricinus communis]EEF49419.1 syntaxin, putative [Ricinus communis]|eukprot:XP_002512916.1 syntaxin-112 [Ricinus communis]